MIVIILALAGAIFGGFTAHRRGGVALDIAQYAAGYALAFSIIGMILTILIDRMI